MNEDGERLVELAGFVPKRKFDAEDVTLREHTYGVLVPDASHPLSCVSVANSSLSIDLWVGCAWQCAYCHVKGSLSDLDSNLTMPPRPRSRSNHSVDEVVEALVSHPFFHRDVTVISIGTASTEPFAPGNVIESTFSIMEAFQKRNLKNPFWIVTKRGVPTKYVDRLRGICAISRGVMVSFCWAANPQHIEPVQNYRFLNAGQVADAGASIAWYMRPLAAEWSGNSESLERMISAAAQNPGPVFDCIVPGGLRIDKAIARSLGIAGDTELLRRSKDDPTEVRKARIAETSLAADIIRLASIYFPNVPIFFKSSCAVSAMLNVPSISGVSYFSSLECKLSVCHSEQRDCCNRGRVHGMSDSDYQSVAERHFIPIESISLDKESRTFESRPEWDSAAYAFTQTILNNIENA